MSIEHLSMRKERGSKQGCTLREKALFFIIRKSYQYIGEKITAGKYSVTLLHIE